ncbi:MAG: MFS transporter, partial [Nitrososphaerota archaeon]
ITFSMFRLSLGVAIPDIMNELLIDEAKAGILFSSPLWSTAVFLLIGGYLADRYGKKRLLAIGYTVLGIGVLGLGLSSGYTDSLLYLILAGTGAGFFVPSYYSIIGEALKKVRGFAIGLAAGVYNLGGFFGSLLLTFFVALHQWRLAYIIISLLILTMLCVQLIVVKVPPSESLKVYSLSLIKKNVLVSAIGIFLGSFSSFVVVAWLPSFFLRTMGWEPVLTGTILGSFLLSGVAGSIVLGMLSDKIGRKRTVMVSAFIATLLSLTIFLTSYPFLAAVAYALVLGFVLWPYWNLFTTTAQESVVKEMVSSATGLAQTFGLVGCAVGPMISGTLIVMVGLVPALLYTTTIPCALYGLLSSILIESKP